MSDKKNIFYTKLKAQLDDTTNFPADYICVSIVLKIESANKVIEYYKKVEKIKGIISL